MPLRRSGDLRNSSETFLPTRVNTEEVCPTHEMHTRYKAYTLDFIALPGVPLVPTSPPRAPRASVTQSSQRDISNVEFYQSIYMLA